MGRVGSNGIISVCCCANAVEICAVGREAV